MAAIDFTVTDPAGRQTIVIRYDDAAPVEGLLKHLVGKFAGIPSQGTPVLYEPRKGVLPPGASLSQANLQPGAVLRYWVVVAPLADVLGALPELAAHTVSARLGAGEIRLVRGDITRQATDAIVNAAARALQGGGGVDGAIHRAAGPAMMAASSLLAPCLTGEAVLTPGFNLPARWVIHTVGPIYRQGDVQAAPTLSAAYRNSLALAGRSGFRSLAFPSISTGAYGYPVADAARLAVRAIIAGLAGQEALRIVKMVLFSDRDFEVYRAALAAEVGTELHG